MKEKRKGKERTGREEAVGGVPGHREPVKAERWTGCHVGWWLLISSPSPPDSLWHHWNVASLSLMTTWQNVVEVKGTGGGVGGGAVVWWGRRGRISETERKRMGRSYFIMHQIRKNHNLSLHPWKNKTKTSQQARTGKEKKEKVKKKCQSPSSSRWAKLICKYMQEIKKQNYTGKWGSYTWIVRIMNNYCEFPAPNITCFLINKDLIIEMRWRISAALINLAEKTSPRWPPVMKRACPESVWGSEPRGARRANTRRRPATVPRHTQEGHNFFR